MGSPRHGNGKARSGQDIEAQEILNQPSGNFGFGRRCRRDLRVGFADDTVAAVALGRVRQPSARAIKDCTVSPLRAVAHPSEIVTRPSLSLTLVRLSV
jgi:hypothetical protein